MAGSPLLFGFYELRSLWLGQGGPEAAANTMAAVALAESGGCRYALHGPKDLRPFALCTYTYSTGENSVGLWQINLMAHRAYSVGAMFDPVQNARAAVTIYRDSGPGAWSTYTSGAYRSFVPAGAGAPPPRAASPRNTPNTQLPSIKPVPVRGGDYTSAVRQWRNLMVALGSTMPTQARRARRARGQFSVAVM